MKETISVIIPVFKVEDYLDACVNSVVNQTYKDLEIILVDDGSPDQCPELCDAWALKDERIKVIHKENGGLSDARNAGLDIAEGQYIAFVDSDDWISPKMYEIMLKHLKEKNADICACGIMTVYPDRKCPMNIQPVIGGAAKIFSLLYDDAAYPVSALNKLYKRDCWKELRFPLGKICEDAFTTYKLIDKADLIVQITDPLYFYRIRKDSIMTATFSHNRMDEEEAWRYNYEFISEHYPLLANKAFGFYLQRVNNLIHTIPSSEKHKFEKEYTFLYKILKNNIKYLLFSSRLNLKYRIKFFMDFIQL